MITDIAGLEDHAAVAELFQAQLDAFPDHEAFLRKRLTGLSPADWDIAEHLASLIVVLGADRLAEFCSDYRWYAGTMLEEEFFFRREDRYRLSTFAEAEKEVYGDPAYMARYVNGLLVSQLWWRNHTEVMAQFRSRYLGGLAPGARHLEIGPGHGLFLYEAALSPRIAELTGWDVSSVCLDKARETFALLAAPRTPDLGQVDMYAPPERRFDSIAFSEVLEHVEDPEAALAAIWSLLAPGGRAFINVPVNSPAPDHIFLFRTPEEIVERVKAAGFDVETVHLAPATGITLERARKHALTISTVIIAVKPANAPN
ncbi:MAG: class I SAM-dependent methyltransferase [Caulobacteraceae bacterium]